jgi:pimeloyl-ACP methyl ester carboxylesterase
MTTDLSDVRLQAGPLGKSRRAGRLHCVEAGDGPLVVLLHGFPECWYSWRHQLPALAEAGFRAVAADLRGYNTTQPPTGVKSYRVRALLEDLAGLIEALGTGPVFLAGHDWGGVLAWRLAATRPELVRKLAILNAPHPSAMRRELWRNPAQWLRSWYVLVFQLPWLPERMLSRADFASLDRIWRRQPVNPAAFSAEDIANYKRAFGGASGLTGPLHYYRAALRYPADLNAPPQEVSMPTLLIWGLQDIALGPRLTRGLDAWVPNLRVMLLEDASHWVQQDAPQRVNQALIEHFRK